MLLKCIAIPIASNFPFPYFVFLGDNEGVLCLMSPFNKGSSHTPCNNVDLEIKMQITCQSASEWVIRKLAHFQLKIISYWRKDVASQTGYSRLPLLENSMFLSVSFLSRDLRIFDFIPPSYLNQTNKCSLVFVTAVPFVFPEIKFVILRC